MPQAPRNDAQHRLALLPAGPDAVHDWTTCGPGALKASRTANRRTVIRRTVVKQTNRKRPVHSGLRPRASGLLEAPLHRVDFRVEDLVANRVRRVQHARVPARRIVRGPAVLHVRQATRQAGAGQLASPV